MLHQKRFCDDGPDAARPKKLGDGGEKMDDEHQQIPHGGLC
ncbi:MAG: hypothetical protein OEU36_02670 [Gammaproteobacteria bacterium]|jgi:hypothetical protein|nr:hypothetical protein [Gammaproteobacteria bacterium]